MNQGPARAFLLTDSALSEMRTSAPFMLILRETSLSVDLTHGAHIWYMDCVMGEPCVRTFLSQQVYDQLRKRIVSGELHRGCRLNIAKLANDFSVSAIPVREALKRLAERGLVCEKPSIGYYVTKVSRQDILDIFDLRMLLEPLALPHVIEGEALARLEKIRQDHEVLIHCKLGLPKLREEFMLIEESLHCKLILGSLQNGYLRKFVDIVNDNILMISQFHCNIMQALHQHLAVIDSLIEGDLSGSSRTLRRHLESSVPLCVEAYEEERRRRQAVTSGPQ